MDTEQATHIVSSFIATYYGNFVRENIHTIMEMYNDASSTTVAKLNETVATTNRGKQEIRQYLERLSAELGPRKVHITTADSIPTTDGSILVSVGGQVFTRLAVQTFTQTFVLSSTKHRTRTLFIAAESLRFVAAEAEVIPNGAVLVAPGEDIATPEPEVAVVEKTPAPVRERKPREPREPKAPKKEVEAAPVPAPAPPAPATPAEAPTTRPQREPREPRKERAPREKKPAADVAPPTIAETAAAPAPAEVAKPLRPLTCTVRLHEVPQTIRLSVVTAAVAKFGEVLDARWFGENSMDCLVDFKLPMSVKNLVFAKGFAIESHSIKRSFFNTIPQVAKKAE